MAWLLLVMGLGYFALSAAALYLRRCPNAFDLIGSAILITAGVFGLMHAQDTGWPFTLMLAGLVVGATLLGWSLRRWGMHRSN